MLTTNDDAVSDGDCELIFLFIGQRNNLFNNYISFGMVLKVIMAIIIDRSDVFKNFKHQQSAKRHG